MKKHIANTTTFKLCVYFSHKECNTPYTQYEKSLSQNRKYIDSYDYIHKEGGITVTRHDLAYMKLIGFVDKHWGRIDRCFMYWNDFENQLEVQMGIWDKPDFRKNQLCEPIFDKRGMHVVCIGVERGGIKTDKMRIGYVKQKAA